MVRLRRCSLSHLCQYLQYKFVVPDQRIPSNYDKVSRPRILKHGTPSTYIILPSFIMCITFLTQFSCGCRSVSRTLTCPERKRDQCPRAIQQVTNVTHECASCLSLLAGLRHLNVNERRQVWISYVSDHVYWVSLITIYFSPLNLLSHVVFCLMRVLRMYSLSIAHGILQGYLSIDPGNHGSLFPYTLPSVQYLDLCVSCHSKPRKRAACLSIPHVTILLEESFRPEQRLPQCHCSHRPQRAAINASAIPTLPFPLTPSSLLPH